VAFAKKTTSDAKNVNFLTGASKPIPAQLWYLQNGIGLNLWNNKYYYHCPKEQPVLSGWPCLPILVVLAGQGRAQRFR
jgi:hypothetical protein